MMFGFTIRSLCNLPVNVGLSSDLPTQIGFQLCNENINDQDSNRVGDISNPFNDCHCQLFNLVGLVNNIEFLPNETRSVILVFRPRRPLPSQGGFVFPSDHLQHLSNIYGNEGQQKEKSSKKDLFVQESFLVSGHIFLTAQVEVQNQEAEEQLKQHYIPTSQECVMQLNARLCQCHLGIDTEKLTFKDCVVGKVYSREVTITNNNEIRVPFALTFLGATSQSSLFEFQDADATEVLHVNKTSSIEPYSHKRIRITYKPNEGGYFNHTLIVDNKFDEENALNCFCLCCF
eukprot:c20825_g1_i4.p1 GENE.c20825_g1_i4~~c20825_g1_i4.p1  ORF type:complete len:288 (-),score=88.53 c20825_g1_i4:177-1040(-)